MLPEEGESEVLEPVCVMLSAMKKSDKEDFEALRRAENETNGVWKEGVERGWGMWWGSGVGFVGFVCVCVCVCEMGMSDIVTERDVER